MKSSNAWAGAAALALSAFGGVALAQPSTAANSVGMEFVLVQPGQMQVGVFHPGCPTPTSTQAAAASLVGAPLPGGVGPGGGAPPAAAPAPGNNAAARPAARAPDPRNAWSAEDYALCAKLSAEARSDGFTVKLPKPYYVGKYEVTQEQWRKVMGNNPSVFQGDKADGDSSKRPVDSVSWADANRFVAKLNQLEGTKAYRLPSEFEWEYACRAGGPGQEAWLYIMEQGVIGAGGFGAPLSIYPRPPGAAAPPPPAPADANAPRQKITTKPVGTKKPNAWGLYDMLGNTWEWTADSYNEKIFADPKPTNGGKEHVLKGGGFAADVKNAICATHAGGPADGWDVGFRVVKDVG